MPGLVEGKAGLVTGAAGGIGRATALALAREGAAGVLVTDLEARRENGLETVRLIEQEGGHAEFVAGDVSVDADCRAVVERTLEAFGHIDFAHNNAGVELQDTVIGTAEADFDRVIAVNLKGVWLGMKHQIPRMLENGGGAIVNTASLAGLIAVPSLAAYIASKHGVVGLTRAAAVEHANDGVRVNCVCPAAIRTAMIEILPPERQRELIAPQAMDRLGEPAEVAESVVWLMSDRSSFVTGIALSVDAGATAGG
ncbi:MAG TPA: glucose 1-dehydrogenase [Solirubrobacteraceae bacterium]|jgi:NAD(P)-dependent dehydrogenase (short-subunit alcohol dehydrogenase family)